MSEPRCIVLHITFDLLSLLYNQLIFNKLGMVTERFDQVILTSQHVDGATSLKSTVTTVLSVVTDFVAVS